MCIFIYNLSDAVQLFGGIFHLINRVPEKASLVPQRVKRLPAVQETWVRSLGQEDPLEKEMAAHSSTLAWKIPWTEKPGRLQSMGSQRVGHDWATSLSLSLEKAMATHSSTLAWRIPGTVEPGGLPSMRLHRVRHDWSDSAAAVAACHYTVTSIPCFIHRFYFQHLKYYFRKYSCRLFIANIIIKADCVNIFSVFNFYFEIILYLSISE